MRYIGNKTKLLGFIGDFLDRQKIAHGIALDAFAGTASVGAFFKSRNFDVLSCDIMTYSYVLQRALIVADGFPQFVGLQDDLEFCTAKSHAQFKHAVDRRFETQADLFSFADRESRPLEEVLVYLDTYQPPISSFITSHFSSDKMNDEGERMYFTRTNASVIDATRERLETWRSNGRITEDEYFVLLAALLEGADSVANTAGVYAAYIKSWQSNAKKPVRFALPKLARNGERVHRAFLSDVNSIAGSLGPIDLLYLDPPYNTRQYSGYYHVPELIARGWFDETPTLRGKTGLISTDGQKSAWSTRDGCVDALAKLLDVIDSKHVVMSYNNEGIIPEQEIERLFKSYGCPGTYERISRSYQRYRSDASSDQRQYIADEVSEYLYYVRRD